MSREEITDPEVLADLYLRASSERDPSRSAQDPTLAYRRPVLVEQWPCRARCGATVGVDDAAVHARDAANAQLRRRGQPELGTHEIAFCPTCKLRAAPDRADALRRRSDDMAKLIAELKTLVDNDLRERSILARLRDLGHPDVDGLRKAIAERAKTNTTTKRRTI